MRKTMKLSDTEKNLLKEAKLLMMLSDLQEQSEEASTQQEAERNRLRLMTVLQKLHIIRRPDTIATPRETELTSLWDDWIAGHNLPGADLLGRVHGHASAAQRILDYVRAQDGFTGDYHRLASGIGCALSTTHDAVEKLVSEKKISVEKLGPRRIQVVVL